MTCMRATSDMRDSLESEIQQSSASTTTEATAKRIADGPPGLNKPIIAECDVTDLTDIWSFIFWLRVISCHNFGLRMFAHLPGNCSRHQEIEVIGEVAY